jgi:hypothetical protein
MIGGTWDFSDVSVKSDLARLERGIGKYDELVVVLTQLLVISESMGIDFNSALDAAMKLCAAESEHLTPR